MKQINQQNNYLRTFCECQWEKNGQKNEEEEEVEDDEKKTECEQNLEIFNILPFILFTKSHYLNYNI